MPRQARPDARRRRGADRPGARQRLEARRAQTSADASRRSPSSGLTTRAAILGLVVCGLVVSAALPLRELLDQRGQIADVREQTAAAQKDVDALELRRKQLDDPDYIRNEARSRLHFVVPGELQYRLILPPSQAPAPVQGTVAAPVGKDAPWYSQLYGTVESADRPPTASPSPSPSPTR